MRSLFFTLMFLFVASYYTTAQNTMSLSSAEGQPDDIVEIELSVSNADSFIAFQTEIPLGEHLSYVENSAVLYRSNGHQFSATVVDGSLKIFAYSFSNAAFIGNEGKIFFISAETWLRTW